LRPTAKPATLGAGKAGRILRQPKAGILRGDDRRRLVPLAVCAALSALIDDEGLDPSARRVELRVLRARLQRLFGLDTTVNESELAHDLLEDDETLVSEAP